MTTFANNGSKPNAVNTVARRLASEFAEARAYGSKVIAIVDPASYPQTWARFGAEMSARGGTSPFSSMGLTQDTRVAPCALPMLGDDDPVLREVVGIALAAPAVVWASLTPSAESMAGILGTKLQAELADGAMITLRYYDPRVLPELLRVLDESQAEAFHASVAAWWWLDRRNAVQRHVVTSRSIIANNVAPIVPSRLRLSDEQVDVLLAASFCDRVLDLARKTSPSMARFDLAESHALVTHYIACASQWKLSSEADCATYIAVALQEGPDFHDTPAWRPLMEQVRNQNVSFVAAIAAWEAQHGY